MDGLISVDEARAYAREHWPSPVVRRPLEALLDNCPRFRQQWISVEDRLPEEGRWVVAYFGNLHGCIMAVLEWTGEFWRDSYRQPEGADYITHWMPLPEPPKEDVP